MYLTLFVAGSFVGHSKLAVNKQINRTNKAWLFARASLF